MGGNFSVKMEGMSEAMGEFNTNISATQQGIGKITQTLATFNIATDFFTNISEAFSGITVSRCRTAKQLEEFSAPDNMRLFPNLRWLPSRSATPREQHMLFYNRVWAKDDPFWAQNTPGNLWNCKCDWEETADPTTDGNPTAPVRHDGLEGNPAQTGEVFTDNCAYVKHSGQNRRERDMVEMKCRALERKILQDNAKNNPILEEVVQMQIEDKMQNVEFTEWGIKETAQSIFNDKSFWIKNEVLNNCRLLNNAEYI